MVESSQNVTVVALLADPDAPTEVAQHMARDLPALLADASGQHRRFDVEGGSEPFTAGTEDLPTVTRRLVGRGQGEEWDVVVAFTDLPVHTQGRKLVADLSHEHNLALLSLPSLGGLRLRRRARRAVEEAVLSLADGQAAGPGSLTTVGRRENSPGALRPFTRPRSATRRPRISGTSSTGRAAT